MFNAAEAELPGHVHAAQLHVHGQVFNKKIFLLINIG